MTSYYLRITIFVIKKAKTAKNILDKKAFATGIFIVTTALQFLKTKKQKHIRATGFTSCYFCLTIFAIKNMKTANKLLDIKTFITGTSASIPAIAPCYNIDKQKSENIISIQLARPQIHIVPYILGRKTSTSN